MYNLHTHSFYCGHGSGTIAEYAKEAERLGFSVLGFSEHCPFSDNFLSSSRMPYSDMVHYERDVRSLDCPFPVILGYEVDYFKSRHGYYEEIRERADYLIGGTHYIFRPDGTMVSVFDRNLPSSDLKLYADSTIAAMASGLFSFYAHPDVFLSSRVFGKEEKAVSMAILDAAMDLGIPLELNGNGYLRHRGYPSVEFWTLAAERGIPAIVSSDAHRVEDLGAPFEYLKSMASEINLNLLEPAGTEPLEFRMVQVR